MKNNTIIIVVALVLVVVVVMFMMSKKQPTVVQQAAPQPESNIWDGIGALSGILGALNIGSGGGSSYEDDPNFTGPVQSVALPEQIQEEAAERQFSTLVASVEGMELNG
jgi:hypothetical protein